MHREFCRLHATAGRQQAAVGSSRQQQAAAAASSRQQQAPEGTDRHAGSDKSLLILVGLLILVAWLAQQAAGHERKATASNTRQQVAGNRRQKAATSSTRQQAAGNNMHPMCWQAWGGDTRQTSSEGVLSCSDRQKDRVV